MVDAGKDVSLQELETRLATFTAQLAQIQQLLHADPENVEFQTISRDLTEVIRLTKETMELKVHSSFGSGKKRVFTEAMTDEEEKEKNTEVALELSFTPGTVCEAKSDSSGEGSSALWYPAYIESVTSANTYNVHFLGFGTKSELSAASLRPITPAPSNSSALFPSKESIPVGFKCEAKYYVDSQYYPCSVSEKTHYGFQVLFDGYGNSEEVPYEYLRPLSESTASVSSSTATSTAVPTSASRNSVVKPPAAIIDKPIKIPENLQILPTDTEAEKERKRKRIRAIKSLNRHKNIDNERNMKQHDWKSFQHKALKKKKPFTKNASIFASPDTVEGRVGVVGSGQGMTNFQDARKKFKKTAHPSTSTNP